jgi:galactokinase
MNTNKRRELAEGKYNERRSECDAALQIINTAGYYKDLCSVDLAVAEKMLESEPTLFARTKHAITENKRVLEAAKVLKEGDLSFFGKLLKDSHYSLKNDYEVTGLELDAITDAANGHSSCLGSRMTGAGFGGCALAIVQTSELDNFQKTVSEKYLKETGLNAEFYVSKLGDGVGVW